MRTRRLTIRPIAPGAHPSGARVYDIAPGAKLAVVQGRITFGGEREIHAKLNLAGFKGEVIVVQPSVEFTLCEVDDGAPARWEEDGLPSYAALQQEVAALRFALEQVAPRVGGAACGPGSG